MTAIEFTVLGTPAPQGSKKGFYNKHIKRVQLVDDNKEKLHTWRGDVVRAAVEARGDLPCPLFDGPVIVTVEFRFARPKGHYRTGRFAHLLKDSAPRFPSGKPDIDKTLRATLDAITTSQVWADDKLVVEVHMRKRYADHGHPGATIRIVTPEHVELVVSNALEAV